jgi:hypothetical protein
MAALLSPSWGKFQILSHNFQLAGFGNVESFVTSMCASEQHQLQAFVVFIQNVGATEALATKNWSLIAEKYNGQQQKGSTYAKDLRDIYDRLHD